MDGLLWVIIKQQEVYIYVHFVVYSNFTLTY